LTFDEATRFTSRTRKFSITFTIQASAKEEKKDAFSKSLTTVGHHNDLHLLPEMLPTETMKEKEI